MNRRFALIAGITLVLGAAIAAFLIFVVFQPGLARGGPRPPRSTEWDGKPVKEQCKRIAASEHAFAAKIFKAIGDAEPDQGKRPAMRNTLISPLSIQLALAMTYNGAVGETKEAMAKALELEGFNIDELNDGFRELSGRATNDADNDMRIANSLWAHPDYKLKSSFAERVGRSYGAHLRNIDLSTRAGVDAVNEWVNENTQGMIPKMVDRFPPDTVVALLNAVYFHGLWAEPFEPVDTTERPFTLPDGTRKRCDSMHITHRFRCGVTSDYEAVRLPYRGRNFCMYVVMPAQRIGLPAFLDGLSPERLRVIMSGLDENFVMLWMPKFEFDYRTELNTSLSVTGMAKAFAPGANFTEMKDGREGEPLFIDVVLHKARIEVDETGTKAAAVTMGNMNNNSAAPPRDSIIDINRPFFFLIRDESTGAILFMGTVTDPTDKGA